MSAASQGIDFGLADDLSIIALLRSGEHAQLLGAIFGPAEYARLRQLAHRIDKPVRKNAPRVYILPGLMGSRLGTIEGTRKHSLWLNLQSVAAGELSRLTLSSQPPVQVLGAMLQSYLKLKLVLTLAGFDAQLYAYDWRKSVLESAAEFVRRLAHERSGKVALIGHSMGGLVARAAMSLERRRIGTVIQLGAPNLGSFAPVQAFRAVYPSMLKLAALDPQHSPDQLARDVFRTLPGLYELLPTGAAGELDLSLSDSWPDSAARPDASLLKSATQMRLALSKSRSNCHHIVGVEQDTVVSVAHKGAELVYSYSRDGDGTVPRLLSEWSGARTWYAEERHGGLPTNEDICKAIVDLLKRGDTRRLRKTYRLRDETIRSLSDTQLREQVRGKVKLETLPIEERRSILEPMISPQFAALAARNQAP